MQQEEKDDEIQALSFMLCHLYKKQALSFILLYCYIVIIIILLLLLLLLCDCQRVKNTSEKNYDEYDLKVKDHMN